MQTYLAGNLWPGLATFGRAGACSRRPQEAQDVVQEAFCRALTQWREISTYEEPVAWVRRVAWNLATSQIRRSLVGRGQASAGRSGEVQRRLRRGYAVLPGSPS
jgi:DNA-directed RNA polymerase specialized sigma24 family protein